MILRIEFAACYVYSPAGTGETCQRSRLLRELLKEGDASFMRRYALRVQQQVAGPSQMTGFLTSSDVLVPVPGSRPRSEAGRHAASRLAEALLHQGLGRETWNGLKRMRPVQKSATSRPAGRPTVALHYESFAIEDSGVAAQSLVLVDDVVTKGRTLLAAAARLHEAFPRANIKAFALLRTMGLVPNIRCLLAPCKGSISWRSGDARRYP